MAARPGWAVGRSAVPAGDGAGFTGGTEEREVWMNARPGWVVGRGAVPAGDGAGLTGGTEVSEETLNRGLLNTLQRVVGIRKSAFGNKDFSPCV